MTIFGFKPRRDWGALVAWCVLIGLALAIAPDMADAIAYWLFGLQ
jgi:hypothetical protein